MACESWHLAGAGSGRHGRLIRLCTQLMTQLILSRVTRAALVPAAGTATHTTHRPGPWRSASPSRHRRRVTSEAELPLTWVRLIMLHGAHLRSWGSTVRCESVALVDGPTVISARLRARVGLTRASPRLRRRVSAVPSPQSQTRRSVVPLRSAHKSFGFLYKRVRSFSADLCRITSRFTSVCVLTHSFPLRARQSDRQSHETRHVETKASRRPDRHVASRVTARLRVLDRPLEPLAPHITVSRGCLLLCRAG
jgi:hypothetical protein